MIKKKFKKKYESKIAKRDKIVKRTVDFKWIIQISIFAFIISLIFSGGAGKILESFNIYLGLMIVLFFIIIGAVFDMIGIAVTSADQKPFHSMATKQVKGSKISIKMIKNAEKVSVFCNDVVGDICNIISGSAGAAIALSLSIKSDIDPIIIALLVTATIASITVGGKAIGRSFAINKSELIVHKFAKILSFFESRKSKRH